MDDFLKLALAGLGVYTLLRLTEPQPYIAPYYVPYYFPWISNRYFQYGASGFPWRPVAPFPRPPLGDGEGIEMGGGGHGGGHER